MADRPLLFLHFAGCKHMECQAITWSVYAVRTRLLSLVHVGLHLGQLGGWGGALQGGHRGG